MFIYKKKRLLKRKNLYFWLVNFMSNDKLSTLIFLALLTYGQLTWSGQ